MSSNKEDVLNNFAQYRPVGAKIMILPDPKVEKTAGGLILPDDAQDKPLYGLVIAAGAKCEEVEAGDRVDYGSYAGLTKKRLGMDGNEYETITMHEVEVLCVVE